MDVEPCYPLFSAELESAVALASSQQKFQTLHFNGPHHDNVRSLNEDWKVGPFVPRGVSLIPPDVRIFLHASIFLLVLALCEEKEPDALYSRKMMSTSF